MRVAWSEFVELDTVSKRYEAVHNPWCGCTIRPVAGLDDPLPVNHALIELQRSDSPANVRAGVFAGVDSVNAQIAIVEVVAAAGMITVDVDDMVADKMGSALPVRGGFRQEGDDLAPPEGPATAGQEGRDRGEICDGVLGEDVGKGVPVVHVDGQGIAVDQLE